MKRIAQRTTAFITGALLLAGCGGVAPAVQNGSIGRGEAESAVRSIAMTSPAAILFAPRSRRGRSWVTPGAASRAALLYVADAGNGEVEVYDYPSGTAVGAATGFQYPYGVCSDKHGDVYVTDFDLQNVTEFRYGSTTPLRRYHALGYPIGCSVDSVTGNLAIAAFQGLYHTGISIYIYHRGSRRPATIDATQLTWPPGYDPNGNLFFLGGGGNCSSADCLEEVPAGSSTPELIALNTTINFAGAVEWDGQYLAVTDQAYGGQDVVGIYETVVSGSTATVANTVTLNDTCNGSKTDVVQPAFFGKKPNGVPKSKSTQVLGGNLFCQNRFDIWPYTAGGNPLGQLVGPVLATGQIVVIKGS